jgi:hypothetical protein
MWKRLWKKWTLDKPAAFGELLWEVFVVQLAALLDRLTLRRVIAFIPIVILVLAYDHSIPIPPTLMLVGDLLAYMDIFAVIFLLSIVSRVETIMFVLKQGAARAGKIAGNLLAGARGLDFRHRREGGTKSRKRIARRSNNENDDPAGIFGVAWA